MKKKRFAKPASAAKFAKNVGYKAIKGAATKLKDGRKANWYTFKKVKK
jgi:hypothetical protein